MANNTISEDTRERYKATALLKAALEFNANIVIIAIQVMVTGKRTDSRELEKNLRTNFETYKVVIDNIFKKL